MTRTHYAAQTRSVIERIVAVQVAKLEAAQKAAKQ